MFDNIEDEKKRKILQTSLEEFAVNGYDFSTNVVAQRAGISKGLIFFHFKNKNEIIYALVDEVVGMLKERLLADYDSIPKDFFERLRYIVNVKYSMSIEMPVIYNFSWKLTADFPKDPELKNEIFRRMYATSDDVSSKLLKDADYSGFRKDIDIKDSVNICINMFQGLYQFDILREGSKAVPTVELLNRYVDERNHYLDVLKKIFLVN